MSSAEGLTYAPNSAAQASAQVPLAARATDDAWPSRRQGLLLWLAAGVVLLAALGVAPVTRTQEARVLETAREMLESGGRQWLIPHVNGRVRMQKPPLAYWLTAGAFKLFGVSEAAGRVPAALCGWLTVGLTASLTARLFNRRAAFFSAAGLLGSYLFFRHSRLAETDIVAALFVTAAVYAFWRAYRADDAGSEGDSATPPAPRPRRWLWFHAAALAMALALLAKGPPAAYPLIFFVALSFIERRWGMPWRFVASGAPLTLALVALPWFLYVARDPTVKQLTQDLKNSAGGGSGHSGLFLNYFPLMAVATAPWTALVVVAVAAAVPRRRDPRVKGLLVWTAAILVPLFLWGNKQAQYLVPLMPPLMVLLGWLIDEALRPGEVEAPVVAAVPVLLVTVCLFAVASPAAVVAARILRGRVLALDVAVAGLLAASVAGVLLLRRRRETQAVVTAGATILSLLVVVGVWSPPLRPHSPRGVAEAVLARYGPGPYALFHQEDLPLCFHMRRVIPVARNQAELAAMAAAEPKLVVIEPLSDERKPTPLLDEHLTFKDGGTVYRVGTFRSPGTITVPPPPSRPDAVEDDP